MENKSSLLGVVIAVCAGVIASVALVAVLTRVTSLNVNVNADKPVNVTVDGRSINSGSGDEAVGANSGEITYWTSGDFSDDLNVQDDLTVAGDTSFTGGVTLTGNVTSTSVPTTKTSSYTASASSQSLCAIRNTTGADRVLDNVTLTFATTTVTGGFYRFTISQASTAATTGTTLGTDLYNDIVYAVPTDGIRNLTATSTLMGSTGAKVIWRSGNFLNFMVASPTSTFSGTCKAVSI